METVVLSILLGGISVYGIHFVLKRFDAEEATRKEKAEAVQAQAASFAAELVEIRAMQDAILSETQGLRDDLLVMRMGHASVYPVYENYGGAVDIFADMQHFDVLAGTTVRPGAAVGASTRLPAKA